MRIRVGGLCVCVVLASLALGCDRLMTEPFDARDRFDTPIDGLTASELALFAIRAVFVGNVFLGLRGFEWANFYLNLLNSTADEMDRVRRCLSARCSPGHTPTADLYDQTPRNRTKTPRTKTTKMTPGHGALDCVSTPPSQSVQSVAVRIPKNKFPESLGPDCPRKRQHRKPPLGTSQHFLRYGLDGMERI